MPANDPIDTAYLAIGAAKAWDAAAAERMPDIGQLEYVGEIIAFSKLLADKWDQCGDEYPGVWAYEVAEPFGERMGASLIFGHKLDPASLLDTLVAESQAMGGAVH